MQKPNPDDPDLKIKRAKHHINDLGQHITAFLAEKPFKTVIRPYRQRGKRILAIKEKKPIPPEIPLTLGDAAHNLRSALDILIYELISALAPRPEAVQFPFAKDANALESTIKHRQIEIAGKKVERAVRDLKPYGNGNSLFYGLYEIDIADKHKLLLTAGTATTITANDLKKLDLNRPGFAGGCFV